MTFPNDGIDAARSTHSGDLLAAFFAHRLIFALEDGEDPQQFVAQDVTSGFTQPALCWHSAIWYLDPADTTTAHDGITTLVSSDGFRYKSAGVDVDIKSVLSQTISDPPDPAASPSEVVIGDRYIVPAGATGDWAGHDDDIAIYTARGWQFIPPKIGDWIEVEDEDKFVRYSAGGAWTGGQGGSSFDDNSIPASAAINWGKRGFIVENQTTNAPPSASKGTAYIIGPSPTGEWLGKAAQIAVCEANDTGDSPSSPIWTYYVPSNGYQAYDKSQSLPFYFDGSSWKSASGQMKMVLHEYTASGTFTHDARCAFVEVLVVGGSSGANAGGTPGAGGTSSFGSHCSATGGTRSGTITVSTGTYGNEAGTPGSGSGGDINGSGKKSQVLGFFDGTSTIGAATRGFVPTKYGERSKAVYAASSSTVDVGAAGGFAIKVILVADLLTNETVTVGAGGTPGTLGVTGNAGCVIVEEWVLV